MCCCYEKNLRKWPYILRIEFFTINFSLAAKKLLNFSVIEDKEDGKFIYRKYWKFISYLYPFFNLLPHLYKKLYGFFKIAI